MEFRGFRIHYVRSTQSSTEAEHVWWRQHKVRATESSKPIERTLYIQMLPTFLRIEENLRMLLSQYGIVEAIHYQEHPDKPRVNSAWIRPSLFAKNNVAFVIFRRAKHLQQVLQLSLEEPLYIAKTEAQLVTPAQKMEEESQWKMDMMAAEEENNAVMAELTEKHRLAQLQKEEQEEQDEGWITVTKAFKKKLAPGAIKKKTTKRARAKQRKMELVNFYSFQHRDRKKQQWENLRRQYEQAKESFEKARQGRKFKPL
ncbi:Ribosomal RNA-processing protein 7 [Trinorchestia longiramus]|nr:Ribosomal RNA-processing protein 7 [Trinorchestia longiramus]